MSLRLDGVVLAAGRSLRMGHPKALLAAGEETFLARAVRLLREGGCDAVTVVVSAEERDITAAAESLGAEVVINPFRGSEQIDSLRLAVGALPRESAGAVILPVDLPRLRVETIAALVTAFRRSAQAPGSPTVGERESKAAAIVPVYRNEPGHPVVLSRALFPALAAPNLPQGLETVLELESNRVLAVVVEDPGVVSDVDTPDDYRRFAGTMRPVPADSSNDGKPVAPWLSMTREPEAWSAPAPRDSKSPLSALHAAAVAVTAEAGGPAVAIVTALPPAPFAGVRVAVYDDGRVNGSFGDDEVDAAAVELGREALGGEEPLTRDLAPHGDTHSAGEPIVLYAEVHRSPDELVVVGAGHIAVPLAALGIDLGFRVTVLDDRDEFATEERFADGVRVLRAEFENNPFAGVSVGPRTYVALVTRGHKWDFDCLRRLLELPARPRYIGMIGSRRRVRAAFGALLGAGVAREALARVHAPIGIEIGAETPFEIAVSIAAELIQVRRGADPASLTLKERVLDRLLPEQEEIHG